MSIRSTPSSTARRSTPDALVAVLRLAPDPRTRDLHGAEAEAVDRQGRRRSRRCRTTESVARCRSQSCLGSTPDVAALEDRRRTSSQNATAAALATLSESIPGRHRDPDLDVGEVAACADSPRLRCRDDGNAPASASIPDLVQRDRVRRGSEREHRETGALAGRRARAGQCGARAYGIVNTAPIETRTERR